jgi:hypothetical protein
MKKHKVLDYIIENFKFKNDAKIAEAWGVAPPVISKLRNNYLNFSANYILKVYDTTNLSIEEIRSLLKD